MVYLADMKRFALIAVVVLVGCKDGGCGGPTSDRSTTTPAASSSGLAGAASAREGGASDASPSATGFRGATLKEWVTLVGALAYEDDTYDRP